jgi:hypothetical protein
MDYSVLCVHGALQWGAVELTQGQADVLLACGAGLVEVRRVRLIVLKLTVEM